MIRALNQRGMSLVELMVAMVLGLIILGGVIAVFVGASGSFVVGRELDRSQENLRFAANLLLLEFRQATRILESPTGPAWAPIEVAPDQPDVSQAITVRYPVVAFGDAFHCDGAIANPGVILEKRFSVDQVDEEDILVCRSGEGLGSATADLSPTLLAFGIRRIRIEEWIESDIAPDEYSLPEKPLFSMADLANNQGLGLVGVRFLLEHDHVRGQQRTFVITAALRNTVLQWFTVVP